MDYTNAIVATFTAADGTIDKLELWSELTAQEAVFLAAYQTKLASGNSNASEDMTFKAILDRWFAANMG